MAVENGTFSYMPSKLLKQFESEISPLMCIIATANDTVYYPLDDPEEFIAFWRQAGFELPQLTGIESLNEKQFDTVFPWGWSQLIEKNFNKYRIDDRGKATDKQSYKKELHSRLTSFNITERLATKQLAPIVSIPQLPLKITSIQELNEIFLKEDSGIVVKTLWSSSGRGLIFIRNQKQFDDACNWVNAQLKKNQFVIAEPIYNKVQDTSLQFYIHPNKSYEFLGINYFDADEQGKFNKEYLHTPDSIKQFTENDDWINETSNHIIESFSDLNIHNSYQGPIGVDAMFILNKKKEIEFYPFVEANLRCNMGYVNLFIKKMITEQSKGTWQISHFSKSEAMEFYNTMLREHPLQIKDNLIYKGFFPLTPFTTDTRFAAWGHVE